jgi:hypothetical protein
MTPEQKAAFIISKAVCAMAEIEAMKATNWMREIQGETMAYREEAFRCVPDEYGLTYHDVIEFFQD